MAGLVVREHEVAENVDEPAGLATKTTIDDDVTGHLTQAVLRLAAGAEAPRSVAAGCEEVLYVIEGCGWLEIDGVRHVIEPNVGVYVSDGESYQLLSEPGAPLTCVAVTAPIPGDEGQAIGQRQTVVRLADQPALPAGKDREFKFGVTPATGCHGMTQFVGSIPPGRARDHYHEYDEVAFILAGDAILHREGEPDVELGPGSCIHFPRGMVHCVENVGEAPVRVLGVFHPPGSAAAAYHPDND